MTTNPRVASEEVAATLGRTDVSKPSLYCFGQLSPGVFYFVVPPSNVKRGMSRTVKDLKTRS